MINNFSNLYGDLSLEKIDNKVIEEYKSIRSSKVKPATVNIELRTLKAIFNSAIDWTYLKNNNPLKKVKLLRVNNNLPKTFSEQEIITILENVTIAWMKNVILLALNTGLRRNELINLKWADVNFKERCLIVRNGENHSTKSKQERTVPLNKKSYELLKMMKRKNEYVLLNTKDEKLTPNYLTQCFRDILVECNIRSERNFHSLRHTFASMLVQRGVSLYEVSKLLGHSDIRVTQVYAHLQQDNLRNAVELLQ